jgi:adenylate cyclase class 2
MQGDVIETEIKLRINEGAEAAVRLLVRRGCYIRVPRILQIDQVFDRPDGAIRQAGMLLRVRFSGGVSTLTYKGPTSPGPHKSREELEATTQDSDALAAILDRLGYAPSFRYEKYRTTFADSEKDGATIALDETPIGVFLELEGPAVWIDRTAHRLGFVSSDYITASYGSLYRDYQTLHGGPPDMVFSDPDQVPTKTP